MNLVNWWNNLKWNDTSYDDVREGTRFTRAKPLTWKQLFFRDRVAVISNVIIPSIVMLFLIVGNLGK